jgi:class 3 adenylate cyclase
VVTVLFADLVGFTSRSEQLDPEDVRAFLSPYYARLRTELEGFGGTEGPAGPGHPRAGAFPLRVAPLERPLWPRHALPGLRTGVHDRAKRGTAYSESHR